MPALITDPAAGRPPLPANFESSRPQLQYQGAEALIYRTWFPVTPDFGNTTIASRPAFLKHRPSKPYRHPLIDAKLTRHRMLAEARVLAKLRREGVAVPSIYALDWEAGWMLGEWIEGKTVRAVLDWAVPQWLQASAAGNDVLPTSDSLQLGLFELMSRIGTLVAKMHSVGVVHGDLTTSNLILRSDQAQDQNGVAAASCTQSIADLQGDVFLIDFGLVDRSIQDEDRAVDLYVLERALGSTHPQTEGLFQGLLKSYGKSYKGANATLKKLEEVRLRGRKKIMIG